MVLETGVEQRPESRNRGPMLRMVKPKEMAHEFIGRPGDLREAMARTDFVDQNELIDNVKYLQQLAEFEMWDEIDEHINYLVGKTSVGGKARLEALMAAIGIAVPGWGKYSKNSKREAEEIKQMNDLKRSQKEREATRAEVPD